MNKYNREVSLLCPTCGCADFSYQEGVEESIEVMTCASCNRKFTKDELVRENSENIDEYVSEIKKEIAKDITDEFSRSLKKAFSGSKYIKIG